MFTPQSKKVIWPFGDVKTNTARFPKDELAAMTGPNSGDWAVITTEVVLDDGSIMKLMGIGHRRGPEVHTFVSSHGTTLPGNPQKHKDDDLDVLSGQILPRKCPQVLNESTKAQPKIDRGNKKRQFELAMEECFRTESFPFRLLTTVLGICIVDTYYLHNAINVSPFDNTLNWKEAVRRMTYALLHNTMDDFCLR